MTSGNGIWEPEQCLMLLRTHADHVCIQPSSAEGVLTVPEDPKEKGSGGVGFWAKHVMPPVSDRK